MFSGLNLITPPALAPVSVADAKAHSRIFNPAEDSLIAGYISSATQTCEDICKRAFMPQQWQLVLNNWPGRNPAYGGYHSFSNLAQYLRWNHIDIPKPPLVSIVSFTYLDTNADVYYMTQGFSNTVGNYYLDTAPEPGRVCLPFAGIWPTVVLLPLSAIQITYNCGYSLFSGVCNISATGVATYVSGSNFDPSMIGTWMNFTQSVGSPPTIQTGTANVLSMAISSPPATTLQLVMQQPFPLTLPATNVAWTANSVPMAIRNAILYLAAHRYENREPIITGRGEVAIEIPGTVDALLAPYRIYRS